MKKLRISQTMMIATIILIVAFQAYWITKLYNDEWDGLKKETDVIFRETVYKLQVARFKKDSVLFRSFNGDNLFNIDAVNVIRQRMPDTAQMNRRSSSVFITMAGTSAHGDVRKTMLFDSTIDSIIGTRGTDLRMPPDPDRSPVRIFRSKALNDSISTTQLDSAYKKELNKAAIKVPFIILKTSGKKPPELPGKDELKTNMASVGFMSIYHYQAAFANPYTFILKEITPQIIFSLLLIGFTICSFIFLYRNLVAQQRLTAIKNDFISNITHELKTPIATVNVAIEALQNFGGLQNPERTKEYLDISTAELQRLSLLVDKVLKLSMFEKNEISLQREPVNLLLLTEEVMATMKLQFEKQKAVTKLKTTGENFIIEADKLHITSVIYNLLDNALKYSNKEAHITVHIIDHSQFIEVRVTDNGIGIAPEYKHKIFEQFFRVPSGDKHNTKGYGLGLSYVNHIVKRHHGFIEVESELGKGSTFSVKLPFKESPIIHYDHNRKIIKK